MSTAANFDRMTKFDGEGGSNQMLPPSLQASAELQLLYNHLNDHLFDG